MRVLLVEDHIGVRRVIRAMLQTPADTLEVDECSDGDSAVAFYRAYRPDLVLMDLMLPGDNGLAVTRRILAVDPAARVVIVTNHDSPELREAARQAGACGYVLKTNLVDLRHLSRQP